MPRFAKAARLCRADEFLQVRRRGVLARSGTVAVSALPGPQLRLGVAVSRHVGNAVARNRLKRLIREYFRCNAESFPKGDCVVIAGIGAANLNNEDFRTDLSKALGLLAQKLKNRPQNPL